MAHQYEKTSKSYAVDATYCNIIQEDDYCCDTLTKIVNVHN